MMAPAAEHQHRLDDLNPGRRHHAAETNIDDHADADENDRPVIGDSGQQSHQHAGSRHLRHQISEVDHDGACNRRQQRGARFHPAADDIAKSIFAGVAYWLGDQKQDRAKGDQRAKCVERTIHAEQRGQSSKAEKRRGAAPVARQRKTVFRRGELAVGGVEVTRRARALGGPVGDAERDQKNDNENRKCRVHREAPAPVMSEAALAASGSKTLLAMRT